MKANVVDSQLDERLRAYMRDGVDKVFALDEEWLRQTERSVKFGGRYTLAVAALVLLLISALFIPPVRAAVGRLFTFIPGVGIVEKTDSTIYAMKPIASVTEMRTAFTGTTAQARLENAIYANGTLNITVTVNGRYIDFENFYLFVNGVPVEFQSSGWSAWGTEVIMGHEMWIKVEVPNINDLFEVEIKDFPLRLSFTLNACSDYDDLAGIGATDTQNGIPITTTASRDGSKLTVWCYPFNTTGDRINGIGYSTPSIWKNQAYIETESGHRSEYTASGQRIIERFIFDIPEADESATLHIPYLTMTRDESMRVAVPIPANYETVECDVSADFTLGTVRVIEVERKPNENDSGGPDILRVNFDITSADETKLFNSFKFSGSKGDVMSYMSCFDEETGRLQYIETAIADNARKYTFTISELCYYLLGEYVIPLEMK